MKRREFFKVLAAAGAALAVPSVAARALASGGIAPPPVAVLVGESTRCLAGSFRVMSMEMSAAAGEMMSLTMALQSMDDPGMTAEVTTPIMGSFNPALACMPGDAVQMQVTLPGERPAMSDMVKVEVETSRGAVGPVSALSVRYSEPVVYRRDGAYGLFTANEIRRRNGLPDLEDA